MKRILYFMPDNPLQKNAGNKTRALQLLQYFSSRQQKIKLDFVSEEIWAAWDQPAKDDFQKRFPEISLNVLKRKPAKKGSMAYLLFKLIDYVYKYKWLLFKPALPNWNSFQLQKQFNRLLEKNDYDAIIISYVEWATLIENNPRVKNARLIVDTHDFITAQQKDFKSFKLGEAFEREIHLISLFDESWLVSSDEKFIFSQFASKTVHRFVPLMFHKNSAMPLPAAQKKYDLIYLASENRHNIRSAEWFFEEVYPKLREDLTICVIGKINSFIPDLENVFKFPFVEDLNQVYSQSKIAICPMLSGTGIKVKTVEALSYGLPVVSTERGLDGLPSKFKNGCLLAENASEFSQHIERLLSDEQFYSRVCEEGSSFFDNHFELNQGYKKLDRYLELNETPAE